MTFTWFCSLVILVAICFEVFQATNAMKWRSNFAYFSKLQITFPSAVQQIFSCEAREDTFPISHSWAWKEILKMDFNTFFASNKSHLASRSKHIMLTKKMMSLIKHFSSWTSLGDQFFNCETWKFVSQFWTVKRQFWAGKGIIFSGEKAIYARFWLSKSMTSAKRGIMLCTIQHQISIIRCVIPRARWTSTSFEFFSSTNALEGGEV